MTFYCGQLMMVVLIIIVSICLMKELFRAWGPRENHCAWSNSSDICKNAIDTYNSGVTCSDTEIEDQIGVAK